MSTCTKRERGVVQRVTCAWAHSGWSNRRFCSACKAELLYHMIIHYYKTQSNATQRRLRSTDPILRSLAPPHHPATQT